jgi:hypothetical protein
MEHNELKRMAYREIGAIPGQVLSSVQKDLLSILIEFGSHVLDAERNHRLIPPPTMDEAIEMAMKSYSTLNKQVEHLVKLGQIIPAIKLVRMKKSWSLLDAKNYVDHVKNKLKQSNPATFEHL